VIKIWQLFFTIGRLSDIKPPWKFNSLEKEKLKSCSWYLHVFPWMSDDNYSHGFLDDGEEFLADFSIRPEKDVQDCPVD
jgi:hypothetical protein